MATPNAGAWTIRAVTSGTTLPTTEINTNLDLGCYVGFGLRFPWRTVETGRVLSTGTASIGATTINLSTALPSNLADNSTLSFDYGAGMSGPVVVQLNGARTAGATSIIVDPISAQIGSGARAGIYDDTILNNGYNLAVAKGRKFKPRSMGGQWTPSHVAGDGAFTYVETGGPQAGQTSYGPWIDSSGNPNVIFERAYRQFTRHKAEWANAKNLSIPDSVPMLDMTNYSMEYSEMYYGPFLQSFGGSSLSAGRMVTGHSRLVDINVEESWDAYGIPIGHGLSGQGPLNTTVAPGVAQHIPDTYGDDFLGAYVQANGWGYITGSTSVGEWGSTVEASFDANVWPIPVRRAVQDISPPQPRQLGQWDEMIDDALAIGCTYTETYTYQGFNDVPGMNASTAVHNEMIAALNRFNATVLAGASSSMKVMLFDDEYA